MRQLREAKPFSWLKSYPSDVRANLQYPEQSLSVFLERAVSQWPNQTATIFFGKKMTYAELADAVERFATALAELGIKKGDRVAVMLPNCPQTIISYFAVLHLGAVVVPINPVNVGRELVPQLTDVGCKTIIYLDTRHQLIRSVREDAGIENAIYTGLQDFMPYIASFNYRYRQYRKGLSLTVESEDGVLNFSDLLENSAPKAPRAEIDSQNDLAVLQYTGGTTGTLKAAMLTHFNLVANALQIKEWFVGCEEGKEVFLAALPFFHVYGMTCVMNVALEMGATMVLHPRFYTEHALKDIERYRVSIFPGAPAMYVAINSHKDTPFRDLSSVRVSVSGAAALSPDVAYAFEEITGGMLVEGYGLTEASPVTHCNPLTKERKPGSVGVPMPDTECKIVDLEYGTKEMPVGVAGELIIRGPQVMKGYWNKPEETEETLRDGWLYTGDIARLDKSGYTFIVDRKKDMIISGGYNIYPQDIEEVILEMPEVEDVAVVGIPDRYRGETLKAYIVLKENANLTKADILSHCKERLAAYKVPRLLDFRRELPKNMVGKTLRRMLLEEEKSRPSGF
ncbi:long-chain-fatty-acid--CoA ligase [Dethiobacter alkaliphilus]|uniref:long-chain-fatty-acid--CoA ligase n=1 Tax=Dethiobacter alkaliphilus TaxID=427926 RepID=UPI0029623841|nr:long-chain fatty acid--CoA ligase [Dethiobacter alkaliphilus]